MRKTRPIPRLPTSSAGINRILAKFGHRGRNKEKVVRLFAMFRMETTTETSRQMGNS
jgi:hypothetical protein